MTEIVLQVGLSKLLLSLVVAGVALLVQRGTTRPELAHGFWLLAIVTLLLPSLVTLPILDLMRNAAVSAPDVRSIGGDVLAGVVPKTAWSSLSGTAIVLLAWCLGSVAVLAGSIIRMLGFHRALDRAIRPAPEEWQRFGMEAAEQLGLRQAPTMYTTAARVSPMVWMGRCGARLVLPEFLLTSMHAEHARWIVAHELAHLRRGDHLVRWLEWLACVVFWWNPVVWLARRELRAAEERCCDAMVVRSFGADPRVYAGSLVSVLEFLSIPGTLRAPVHASAALRDLKRSALERRLTSLIANSPDPRGRGRALLLASAVMIAPLGLVNYAGPTITDASGYVLDLGEQPGTPKERLAKAGIELKRAVGAGEITSARGRELFLELERRLGEAQIASRSRIAQGGLTYDSVAVRIRGAVEVGKLTPAEGRARLTAYQKALLEESQGSGLKK